jgi:hypothetical protein
MANKEKSDNGDSNSLKVGGGTGVLNNLDLLETKVRELRAAIKAGQPLSMGKTNLLSGILGSLRHSAGSW